MAQQRLGPMGAVGALECLEELQADRRARIAGVTNMPGAVRSIGS
jgi:hypothetical protein